MKISTKNFWLFLCVSLLFTSCSQHPALRILRQHQKLEKTNSVIPYTINLYAIHNLQNGNYNVKPYLKWVLQNLNYPDKHGLTGSIYDRNITIDGVEMSTGGYDSIDSYSATFLILLQEYYQNCGDKKFLRKNAEKIKDIAYTIFYLQDEDGLTTALPGTDFKYFMDNCEVYAGLRSFIALSKELNWELEDFYTLAMQDLESGIQTKLYNPERRNYNWAIDDKVIHYSDWQKHYPDAYAQLFPIVYDLPFIEENLKKELWKKYIDIYGEQMEEIPPEQKIVVEFARKRMEL